MHSLHSNTVLGHFFLAVLGIMVDPKPSSVMHVSCVCQTHMCLCI